VERKELIGKLETMLDDAARTSMFGTIELEIREGQPILIRTVKTEKIQCTGDRTHATQTPRSR
jgi:hypothetical protein